MGSYVVLKKVKAFQQDVESYVKYRLMKKPLRPMFQWVKDNNGHGCVGVEIGVWKGDNAVNVLRNMDVGRLYLIDPYRYYYDGLRGPGLTFDTVVPPEDVKRCAIDVLKGFGDRVVCLFDVGSDDATGLVPSGLDFVYIDGDHSYGQVRRDIVNYFPKVRCGGVFGGHDYTLKYPGVIWAVSEFIDRFGLVLFHDDGDWWIVKEG